MWQDFIQLLYPRLCVVCNETLGRQERFICMHCMIRLPYTRYWLEKDNPAAQLFWGKVQVEWVIPFLHFTKSGMVQKMIHQIKYRNSPELAEYLGMLFGNILKDTDLSQADVITAVPIHPQRLKQRGYNQSEKIAMGIGRVMGLPVESRIVERRMWEDSQTHKGRYERWENVQDAFVLVNPAAVAGRHIILVDDVLTTGATLEACASSIAAADNVKLSIVTLAKAQLA
jgi:ComF family protein